MRKFQNYLALLLVLSLFAACDAGRIYDHSQALPDTGWHKDSTLIFDTEVSDTISLYNFYITVRNNNEYGFRNLYIFLSTSLPNGNNTRDTIELMLADREGKWLGRGFGSIKDNQILVRRNLKFPLSGTYSFKIEQAMRKDIIEGIKDVGIRIEDAR